MEKCVALAVVAKLGVGQPSVMSAACSSLWTRVPGFAFLFCRIGNQFWLMAKQICGIPASFCRP